MVSSEISAHAHLRQLIKSSLQDGLVGFFRSARSRMAHKFSIGFISNDWLGHGKYFIPSFANQSFVTNPLSFSQYVRELHLAWKGWNDNAAFHYEMHAKTLAPPPQRMLMYFSALIFPSKTTSSERPAVQMVPQTITEKPPNLTVGCRCRKENSWNGSHQDLDLTAVRKLCKLGLIREDNGIPKLQRLAYHLWPPLLSTLNVERAKKWLSSSSSTMIPKGMEIANKSSWVLLNHFGHISCSCWRIVFHRSLDGTESPLSWLWTTWVWWSAFLAFTLELHPTLGSLGRAEVLMSRGFLQRIADLNQLVIV